jgi:hypothetical protein
MSECVFMYRSVQIFYKIRTTSRNYEPEYRIIDIQ